MFRKILVPLDGSKLAEKILANIEKLTEGTNASVILIQIGGRGTIENVGEATPSVIKEAVAHVREVAEDYLSGVAAAINKKGIASSWVYREGMPAREIIRYASDNGVDLIALASHGRGEVAWVLGSVAERIVSHATVPVLLVRVIEMKPPLLKEEFLMGSGWASE